jgi:2,4-diaminopentanoate dehydrogenase
VRRFQRDVYRVIQWATGTQGRLAIEMVAAANRPHLDLVGCWVHSEQKAGRDAGELAGVGSVGVTATTDVDSLLAMDADCVIYSPLLANVDEICRILAAGKNLVTQVGDIYIIDQNRRAKIERACQAGGSSYYASGVNPGFFSDRLCATLTTLCSEVEHIRCVEYSHGPPTSLSPAIIFEGMGMGWTQERLDTELPWLFSSGLHDDMHYTAGDFVAAALGFTIDRRETRHRFAMVHRDIEAFGRLVEAGTVGAVSPSFRMYEGDRERLEFTQCWKLAPEVPIDWGYDARPRSFYQIHVTGRPTFDVYWEPAGDGMEDAVLSTAATLVNAIPFVCDAAPGIHTQIDLPMISLAGDLTG